MISRLRYLGLVAYAVVQLNFIWAALLAFVLGVMFGALGETLAGNLPLTCPWAQVMIGLGGLTLLLVTLALLTNRPVYLLPLFLLLGLTWNGLAQARLASFAVPPGEAVFFTGRVVEVGERTESNDWGLSLNRTLDSGCRFILQGEDQNGWSGRLLIFTGAANAAVTPRVGDKLQICGLVNAANETYNFAISGNRYYKSQALAASVTAAPQGLSFRRLAAPYAPQNLGLAVRERIFRAMEILPSRQQTLLKGIGFGDTSMLTNGESGVLAQTGIMHIFAVSGLHIGYVVLLGGWLCRALHAPGWLRFIGTACLVVFFALVAGLTASVLRATIMTLVGGLGFWLMDCFAVDDLQQQRFARGRSCRALILAAFLLLLWRPNWALQPGFLLSFLGTAGIVCTAAYWRVLVPNDILSLGLAAQFMLMPVAAYFFNTISLIGLLVSPFLACLAGFVVILLLLAMPLTLVGLAYIPLAGAGLLAELMYRAAEFFAGFPLSFVYTLRPGCLSLLLYYLLLAAALYFLNKAHKSPNR